MHKPPPSIVFNAKQRNLNAVGAPRKGMKYQCSRAVMAGAESMRADPQSWLSSGVGWEAAGVPLTCCVGAGGHDSFPHLAGMCGDAEPQGVELVLPAPMAQLRVKDPVNCLGTQGEVPSLKRMPTVASCSFLLEFKLLKTKSLHSLNKLFTFAFQPQIA